MCMSSPKSPTPVKVAQAPPVTASTPEFETELAEVHQNGPEQLQD